MPLSAEEKQRHHHAFTDADPGRGAKHPEWEKTKWRKDREQGKKKSIHGCSKRKQSTEEETVQPRQRAAQQRKATSVAVNSLCTALGPESPQPHTERDPSRLDIV